MFYIKRLMPSMFSTKIRPYLVICTLTGALCASPTFASLGTAAASVAPSAAASVATPITDNINSKEQDFASATAFAELGIELLRQQSVEKATGNSVVSPFSLVAALGMLQAGSHGTGLRELNQLLGTDKSGARIFQHHLPSIMQRLQLTKSNNAGSGNAPFIMANRIWVDKDIAGVLPTSFTQAIRKRYQADSSVLQFAKTEPSRTSINAWVAQATNKRISSLLPEGAISANTQLVITNAIHFKSQWEEPFKLEHTKQIIFHSGTDLEAKAVPMMTDEREVDILTTPSLTVIELPFANKEYTLLIAMPTGKQTLQDMIKEMDSTEIASWRADLRPRSCRLALPKFNIAPMSQALKPNLQAMGLHTPFSTSADFSKMLGETSKGVYLDNVYQSASINIDEQGGEAAAATGATLQSKSISLPQKCEINRPFLFSVIHHDSGVPLFIGRVMVPSLP